MTMIATGGESEGTFSESEMRTQALSSPRKERKRHSHGRCIA